MKINLRKNLFLGDYMKVISKKQLIIAVFVAATFIGKLQANVFARGIGRLKLATNVLKNRISQFTLIPEKTEIVPFRDKNYQAKIVDIHFRSKFYERVFCYETLIPVKQGRRAGHGGFTYGLEFVTQDLRSIIAAGFALAAATGTAMGKQSAKDQNNAWVCGYMDGRKSIIDQQKREASQAK